ncbi:MAG: thiamine phosphate synthase, partial [Candidatus Omnitrophota bacterium]
MKSKGLLLRKSLLYLILDRPVFPKGVLGSVGIIQLRDKVSNRRRVFEQAAGLARSLAKSRTLFIVNDYADIALLSGADGVHLGQGDLPLKEARKMMGKE